MSQINYDGRTFKAVTNSPTADVDSETTFRYRQVGDIVSAKYSGGAVRFGSLIAVCSADGTLDMRYSHVNAGGSLMTGECVSRPEILPDGRIRLYESWRWTCGDNSRGDSILEEIEK